MAGIIQDCYKIEKRESEVISLYNEKAHGDIQSSCKYAKPFAAPIAILSLLGQSSTVLAENTNHYLN